MSTLSQNKKNADIIGVSSSINTIKNRCKDGHAPALQLLKGRERMSESRDLRPVSPEKPLDFRAVIIGVFSKAVYLESDGEIFVIHDKKWGYVPFGIPVENVEDYIKNGGFCVGGNVEIAVPERECMQKLPLKLPSEERLSMLEKHIAKSGSGGGILEFYNKFASAKKHIDTLFSAFVNGEDATEHAVALIGLGRGLTPSGDDFLSGMFYLFFEAEKCGFAIPNGVHKCATAVEKNLSRTSKISGAYLSAVLRRERFSIYENATLAALGEGDALSFADKVLPLGASSGTDTLLGALFAARVIERM